MGLSNGFLPFLTIKYVRKLVQSPRNENIFFKKTSITYFNHSNTKKLFTSPLYGNTSMVLVKLQYLSL